MNTALKVLYASNGLFVFAGSMLVPLYALFEESVGASIFIVSTLAATQLASKLVTTIFLRFVGDGIKEKEYLLIIGFILRAFGWVGLIFSPSLAGLFIVQIILGVGDGMGSPAFRAMFATHLDVGHEVKRYSDWELILGFAGATGALLGGYIVTMFGFLTLFALMSILAIISAVIVLVQPRKLL